MDYNTIILIISILFLILCIIVLILSIINCIKYIYYRNRIENSLHNGSISLA